MIWLFNLSVGLLIAGMLMGPLYKLLAPAWASGPAPNRAKRVISQRFESRRPRRGDQPQD
jgi:hypothetical protein